MEKYMKQGKNKPYSCFGCNRCYLFT